MISRESENPNFQDICLYIIKEQRNTQPPLLYQLHHLRVYQTVFAHGINHSLKGNVERKGRLWKQLFLSQDSAPSHHIASTLSQRSKHFDAKFFTSPWEACAVPDEAVTKPLSMFVQSTGGAEPRTTVDRIIWMRICRHWRKSLRLAFCKKNSKPKATSYTRWLSMYVMVVCIG